MVKSLALTVQRWQAKAANAQPDYTRGVQTTNKDWQSLTAASAQNWATGVQDAITRGAFATGVQKVSTAQWKQATVAKAANWLNGIRASGQKYQSSMGPVLQNIASIVSGLGPKGPRGSEQNFKRSEDFQRAMAATRTGGSTSAYSPTPAPLF